MTRIDFPKGFLWGAATASYQIEGSPLADGACPSNWHEFAHTPGRIKDGATGDTACDHYHRYPEDIRIMKDLGLKAYRFSIAWPRVMPEPGRVNARGIDFYSRLIDGLLEAGIEPWATVFHWDMPVWAWRNGGFTKRSAVDALVEHGQTVFRALGDRVKRWISINEPAYFGSLGYAIGSFPPGRKNDLWGMFRSIHHLLLGHARLCQACHALVPGGQIGIANAQQWISPRNESSAKDRRAASLMDEIINRFCMEPQLFGRYPSRAVSKVGLFLPRGFENDLPEMKTAADFTGINYYQRSVYRYKLLTPIAHSEECFDPASRRSAMWEIYPEGIRGILRRMRDEYGNPPIYITENGFPLQESPGRDPLDDPERIAYTSDHLAMIAQAIGEGADCRGYFHWSLLDNFEWAFGFTMPFGLVRTDFATQKREWKRSAHWYQKLIERNWLERE